jgi:hypothetical protein
VLDGAGWLTLYPKETHPVAIEQEAVWTLGPIRTVAEKLALTGIRSPDHPTRNESLYRLSYPGPHLFIYSSLNDAVLI